MRYTNVVTKLKLNKKYQHNSASNAKIISRFYDLVEPVYFYILFPFYKKDFHKILNFISKENFEQKQILDVGCGNAKGIPLQLNANYTGVDTSVRMIKRARKHHPNAHWIVGDFLNWESQKTFDYIICTHGLSVIQPSDKLLSKMIHQLSPSGRLIIIDHQQSAAWRKTFDKISDKLGISFGFRWNQNINLNKNYPSARLIHFETLNLWSKIAVFEKTE